MDNIRRENVNLVREVLDRLNITQAVLAARMTVTRSLIAQWATGHNIPHKHQITLQKMLNPQPDSPRIEHENKPNIDSDNNVTIPILSEVPQQAAGDCMDFTESRYSVSFPPLLIDAGDGKDCYIVPMPGSYIVVKRKKIYNKGDCLFLKIDGAYDFKKWEDVEQTPLIEIKGAVLLKIEKL